MKPTLRTSLLLILLASLGVAAWQQSDPLARLAASSAARAERRASAQAWRDGWRDRATQRMADSRAKREAAIVQQRAAQRGEVQQPLPQRRDIPPLVETPAQMAKKAQQDVAALAAQVGQLRDLAMHLQANANAWRRDLDLVGRDSPEPDEAGGWDAFPWAKVHLSTRMTGPTEATVRAGSIWVGENVAATLATSNRTITEDEQYLWLEYAFISRSFTLASPSTVLPESQGNVYVHPLAKFSLIDGVATISEYLWLGGDIHLPGTWAR